MPNDDGNIEVVYPDEKFRRDTYFIPPDQYDPETHTLADGEDWTPDGDPADTGATPSDALTDVVGTRRANALAEAGLPTIEEALAYPGDLTEIRDVGQGTVEDLVDAADQPADE